MTPLKSSGKRGKKRAADYFSFFIVGIIWVALGIPIGNYPLTALGAAAVVISVAMRNRWRRNLHDWKAGRRQKMLMVLMLVAGLFFFISALCIALLISW
jgi:hypothetical protein